MLPRFNDLPFPVDDLNPIGQNPLIKKIEGGVTVGPKNGLFKELFSIVPKTDREMERQLLIEKIVGKSPGDEEPLPLRGVFLPRIGSPYFRTGQKVAINPLLLHIKMLLITAAKKGEDYEKRG